MWQFQLLASAWMQASCRDLDEKNKDIQHPETRMTAWSSIIFAQFK